MKHTAKPLLQFLAVIALAAGCGQKDSSKGGRVQAPPAEQVEEPAPDDGSNIQGHIRAMFTTLNPQVNGTIPGSANFFRKEERIFAYVRLFAGGVRAWHPQHVYTGGRCPTPADDANGDGFIDIVEAEAVLGKILIPLDSDISSQTAGRRFFPVADLSGYYHYERITNFMRFLADLRKADPDLADDLVKLDPGEGLRLVGRTVMIQGVAETVEFPETVASKGRFRPFQTLPIVCGVFEQVTSAPGTPYAEGEIPGPVAEVEPGQDRPAPDDTTGGDGSTTGGTTGTTGSNESDDGDGPVSDGEGRTSGRSTTGGSGSTTGEDGTSGGDGSSSTDIGTGGGTDGGSSTTTTTTTGGSSSSSTSTDGEYDLSVGI
jgi:hypothetical protein